MYFIKQKRLIILVLMFISFSSSAQNVKTIDRFEDSYQACLDKGINMLSCSVIYYKQMDSMLNVAYKRLKVKLNPLEFSKLKTDQLKWLSCRDKYFGSIVLTSDEESLGKEDQQMIIEDKKAKFVKDRVIKLIKKLEER
jgi:uncharacterized protein YecT (DUF1311 family)